MKQEYKNKFETKIKLNQALENQYISKNNLEFILKHIFKSNHYLIKQYNSMITKENINDIYTEINELLSYGDFFINDRILILWIARKLDDILKGGYEEKLNNYLIEKRDNLKSNKWDNNYERQKDYRTIIRSDDDCFKEYLPLRKSYNCYDYSEIEYYKNSDEEMLLYPQFDDELNYYKHELSDEEIKSIKNFMFNMITEQELEEQINEKITQLKRNGDMNDYYFGYTILDFINKYKNTLIFVNNSTNFRCNILNKYEWDLYDFLKENKIEYNVEDNFFIIDKDDNNNVIEIKSFNNIMSLIDLSEMVRYMRSHNISNLDEMYIDKNYKY